MRFARALAKSFLGVIVATALFGVLELFVALLDLAPPPAPAMVVWNPNRDRALAEEGHEFRPHPRWLWEPRPGVLVQGDPIHEGAYRGTHYPPRERAASGPRPLRIAALGDSSTYGIGRPESESWPRVLETLLRAHGNDAEVLNFGCVGFSAVQAAALYEGRVREYAPDVVVAALGAVNDQFPTLVGQTDREKIAAMASPLARMHRVLKRLDSVRWLEAAFHGPPRAASELRPEDATERVPPDDFEAALARLLAATQDDGARLVLVLPPRRMDGEREHPKTLEYSRRLAAFAAREGLPVADVHGTLRALELDELAATPPVLPSTLYDDPWHPSPKGYRAYAVVVGAKLQELGLVKGRD